MTGPRKPSWESYFFNIAKAVSARATCPRARVGAIVVSPTNRILSTGYNGAPAFEKECIDVGCDVVGGHCLRAIHAEQNAIGYAARYGVALGGSRIWVYLDLIDEDSKQSYGEGKEYPGPFQPEVKPMNSFPCPKCGTLMIATGIRKVLVRTSDGDSAVYSHIRR